MCPHPAFLKGIRMKAKFDLLFVCIFFLSYTSFAVGNTESDSTAVSGIFLNNNGSQISMREQYESGYWISRPSNGKLIVIGISNPMSRRDSEIASAKEDAARKVAMFYGIYGSVETTNRTGADYFDYLYNSNIELIYETNYEQYIEQLTFDPLNDVLITGEAVFIRFQHDTAIQDIGFNARMINNRPSWTRAQDIPVFDGYVTAVGFAINQRRLKDTIYKSTEDAIARMIENLSTTVYAEEITGTGQGFSGYVQTKSIGRLNNFRVVDFWIEPETRFVYTLAIAEHGE